MRPGRFAHFAAIDWSGAAGERHAGIALAICDADDAAPRIVRPGHRWSRAEVTDWLLEKMPGETLVGLDISGSLALADTGAYFPGWRESPPDARSLWQLVEDLCAKDQHLGAGSFVDHPEIARLRDDDRPAGAFFVHPAGIGAAEQGNGFAEVGEAGDMAGARASCSSAGSGDCE